MKAAIGVYDSHEKALNAIKALKEAGYPVKQLSVIGHTEMIEDNLHIKSREVLINSPLAVGVVAGPILGLLAGIGLFAIPGVGIVYGAGAVVGALAGFDLGLIGGGIGTILARLGLSEEKAEIFETQLQDGHFLVIAQGSEEEIMHAKTELQTHGTHHELDTHDIEMHAEAEHH